MADLKFGDPIDPEEFGPEAQQVFAKMTSQQRKAWEIYCETGVKYEAYVRAYNPPSKHVPTRRRAAYKLFTRPVFRTLMQERVRILAERFLVTEERVSHGIAVMAFTDVRGMFDAAGALKPIPDMTREQAMCIAGMDIAEIFEGAGQNRERVGETKKVKLIDRLQAHIQLARTLGMYKEDRTDPSERRRKLVVPKDKSPATTEEWQKTFAGKTAQ